MKYFYRIYTKRDYLCLFTYTILFFFQISCIAMYISLSVYINIVLLYMHSFWNKNDETNLYFIVYDASGSI